MSIEENKRIAAEFIRAAALGDLRLMADDATFFVAGDLPGCGMLDKQKLLSLRDGFAHIAEGEFKVEPTHMIGEGDFVSAEAVGHLQLKDGRVYNNKYHMVLQIQDGKVVLVREYSDTDHLRRIFFLDI